MNFNNRAILSHQYYFVTYMPHAAHMAPIYCHALFNKSWVLLQVLPGVILSLIGDLRFP